MLSIETDKINQNTAQRLNIDSQTINAGVQSSLSENEGNIDSQKYIKEIYKDKNTSFIAKL